MGILLAQKYAKQVMNHDFLHNNRVVWIKVEDIKRENIGLTCIYAFNISTKKRNLWHIILDYFLRDYEWIVRRNFNITEKREDKSSQVNKMTRRLFLILCAKWALMRNLLGGLNSSSVWLPQRSFLMIDLRYK